MAEPYRYPFPPFPLGWFQVAYSDDLKPGEVKPLKYFGKKLVLFRGEDGEAALLDAFCPHLGAHLGYGGVVEGNAIRCPFHAWKFDCSGSCVEVPYGQKIPSKAVIPRWTTREVNGLIMAWHHPNGEGPLWELPEIPEFGNDEWTPYQKRRWRIRTRNQEMAENAVDTAHFKYLHGSANHPDAKLRAEGPVMYSNLNTVMTTPMGEVEGEVQVQAYGFGFTLTRFVGLAETLLVNSVTAIDEEYVDVRFSFTVKKMGGRSITEGIGGAFVREIERQLEQDIPVWQNKKHVKPPILNDGDGPISKYRKWARQFYAEPNVEN